MAIKKNNLNLSIIIPIFNEAKNIKVLIPRIYNNLKNIKHKKIQIILVDDNSNDNIDEVFSKLKKNFKSIYLFKRKTNRDLSKSCILGFNKSTSENILVMDGDLQHDPKYISDLYFSLTLPLIGIASPCSSILTNLICVDKIIACLPSYTL